MICHGDRGMSGASIETTLELWASSLRDVKRRMRPLFTQARVALSAENFLEGLLGEERRKTGWMRTLDPGPWRQQAILGRGQWDADALRDIVRDYALETSTTTRFSSSTRRVLETGHASCGVARQYTVRRARSPTADRRLRCYVAPRGLPSSTANCICQELDGRSGAMAKSHVPREMIDRVRLFATSRRWRWP